MDLDKDREFSIMRLAIHMLDNQDGIDMDTYNLLKEVLLKNGAHSCQELIDNVEIASDRAFLSELWVEENYRRFER